jgi:putative oxidoreductase
MLSGLGFPAAALFAWIVAIVELVGGAALIIGAFSQIVAIPLAIIMLVSSLLRLFGAIGEAGFGGARLDLLLFAATLMFALGAKSALTSKE